MSSQALPVERFVEAFGSPSLSLGNRGDLGIEKRIKIRGGKGPSEQTLTWIETLN